MHLYLRLVGLYVWLVGLKATSAMKIPLNKGLQLEGANGTVALVHNSIVRRRGEVAFIGWFDKGFREGPFTGPFKFSDSGIENCYSVNIQETQHNHLMSFNVTFGFVCLLYAEPTCTSPILDNHDWPFWTNSTNITERGYLDPGAMSYRCWNTSEYSGNYAVPNDQPPALPKTSNSQQASLPTSSTPPQTSISQKFSLLTSSASPQTPSPQVTSVPISSTTPPSKSQETPQSSSVGFSTNLGPPTPLPTSNSQITASPTSSAIPPSKSPATSQPSGSGSGTSLGMRGWPWPEYKGKVQYWNINMTMGWCHSAAFPNGALEGIAEGEASSIRSLTIEPGIVCILFKDNSCSVPFGINNVTVLFTEYANGGPKSNIPDNSGVAYRCWPCSDPNPKDYCGWKPSQHPSRTVKRANLQKIPPGNSTVQPSHRVLL